MAEVFVFYHWWCWKPPRTVYLCEYMLSVMATKSEVNLWLHSRQITGFLPPLSAQDACVRACTCLNSPTRAHCPELIKVGLESRISAWNVDYTLPLLAYNFLSLPSYLSTYWTVLTCHNQHVRTTRIRGFLSTFFCWLHQRKNPELTVPISDYINIIMLFTYYLLSWRSPVFINLYFSIF